MMQTTKARHRDNVLRVRRLYCCRSVVGSLLRQPEMRAVVVVVVDVLVHEALKMALVENDNMIEQIAAAVTDEAFGYAVLPRTAVTCTLGLDAKALHSFDYIGVEVRAAIKD